MSARLFKKDIIFLQRVLKVGGFYDGPLDGKWNSAIDEADAKFDAEFEKIKSRLGEFDKRSEQNIETLLPAAQIKAREFLNAVPKGKLTIRIISGTRTYGEQDALYAIGRTSQMNRRPVTKAKGGQSNHNFGIGWDIGIFEGGKYYDGDTKQERAAYSDLAQTIKSSLPGVEWGGDWSSFPDPPHYQLPTQKSTSEVRALFESGKTYV
jgi:peptidoglycan L-alanyl-D-glutamate endopeptidase CwlK